MSFITKICLFLSLLTISFCQPISPEQGFQQITPEQAFKMTDTNSDGQLSAAEVRAFNERAMAPLGPFFPMGQALFVESAKANKPKLSAKLDAEVDKLIAKSDRNGDGDVTFDEYIGLVVAIAELADADHDGLISRKEYDEFNALIPHQSDQTMIWREYE